MRLEAENNSMEAEVKERAGWGCALRTSASGDKTMTGDLCTQGISQDSACNWTWLIFHHLGNKFPVVHDLYGEGNAKEAFSFVECSGLCNCLAFNRTVIFKGCCVC